MIDKASETVCVTRVQGPYPQTFPYDPDEAFPEYAGGGIGGEANPVYRGVRETLRLLGLDAEHFGQANWNPLGELIRPGDRVFIKPNLVTHEYRASCACQGGDLYAVITHPSVIRAVADYAAIALAGRGELVIGDNPSIDADFDRLTSITGIDRFASHLSRPPGLDCRVLDLRPTRTVDLSDYGCRGKLLRQSGDPEPAELLDLGHRSLFRGINPLLLRGIFTSRWETIRHHSRGRHEYSVSGSILNADVYISLPKLKAHHKVGTTLNLKGLVGICSNKNLLPHWRVGFPSLGGDEFPRAHRARDPLLLWLRQLLSDLLPERAEQRLRGSWLDRALGPLKRHTFECYRGAWDGNDTCWRMVADLYNLFVRDRTGQLANSGRTKRFFSIVDGVLAGEGDGPFCPLGREARLLVGGRDMLHVDAVASRLMDFDLAEIPYLAHLLADARVDLAGLPVISDHLDTTHFFDRTQRYLRFKPPSGWKHLALGKGASDEAHHPGGRQGGAAHAADAQHTEALAGSR